MVWGQGKLRVPVEEATETLSMLLDVGRQIRDLPLRTMAECVAAQRAYEDWARFGEDQLRRVYVGGGPAGRISRSMTHPIGLIERVPRTLGDKQSHIPRHLDRTLAIFLNLRDRLVHSEPGPSATASQHAGDVSLSLADGRPSVLTLPAPTLTLPAPSKSGRATPKKPRRTRSEILAAHTGVRAAPSLQITLGLTAKLLARDGGSFTKGGLYGSYKRPNRKSLWGWFKMGVGGRTHGQGRSSVDVRYADALVLSRGDCRTMPAHLGDVEADLILLGLLLRRRAGATSADKEALGTFKKPDEAALLVWLRKPSDVPPAIATWISTSPQASLRLAAAVAAAK